MILVDRKRERRERASLIFYLRRVCGLSFYRIGKHVGQLKDPTKAMAVSNVVSIYKTEKRRREKLAKEQRRNAKFDTTKERVQADINLEKSMNTTPKWAPRPHEWEDLDRYRKD